MSSKRGGTRMEKPSPKNWFQDLVFEIPDSDGFRGAALVSREADSAVGTETHGVKDTIEMVKAWMLTSLLDFGHWQVLGQNLGSRLGFWGGGFGGEDRRRWTAMESR